MEPENGFTFEYLGPMWRHRRVIRVYQTERE